jgi:uncharacterized iron-regulated membrane protein
VQAEKPGAEFSSVNLNHVGKAGQVVHLGMRTPGHLAMANSYYFKGDGTPLGDGGLEEGGAGQQILGALQPVHFGWFGGFAVKIAYGVLGLAITIVTHTGVTIWLARRRDKGRPVPGWERIWAAVGWGQPLAIAVAALVSLYVVGAPLIAYLATVTAALVFAGVATSAEFTTTVLRWASAVALLALVAAHAALWFGRVEDPMAWIVSAVLVAIACILCPLPRLRRASTPAAASHVR